jgi:hypothetical protein
MPPSQRPAGERRSASRTRRRHDGSLISEGRRRPETNVSIFEKETAMTYHGTEMTQTDELEITATYGTTIVVLRRNARIARNEDGATADEGNGNERGHAFGKPQLAA